MTGRFLLVKLGKVNRLGRAWHRAKRRVGGQTDGVRGFLWYRLIAIKKQKTSSSELVETHNEQLKAGIETLRGRVVAMKEQAAY